MNKVESYLGRAGYPAPLGGTYGPAGEDSVRRYQADRGLKVDGLLNPGGETEGSLRRQLSLPPVGRVRKVRNPDLDALADGAPFHNRRTVEHLMTTAEDGDLPRFMATAFANDGAAGRGEVVDLLDQLGRRDPARAKSLRAKVDRLLPDGVAVPEATVKVRDAPAPAPQPQPAPPAEKPPEPKPKPAPKTKPKLDEACPDLFYDAYSVNREISLLYDKIRDVEGKLAARKAELQTRLQNRPNAPSFNVALPDLGAIFSRDPRKRALEWAKTGAENEIKRREYERDSQVRGFDDDVIGHIQAEIAELEREGGELGKTLADAEKRHRSNSELALECYRKKVGEDPW